MGNTDEGVELFGRAFQIRADTVGNGHLDFVHNLFWLADRLKEKGEDKKAKTLYRMAIGIWEKIIQIVPRDFRS